MPRKRSPGTVSVEDAAELLGFDAQTLRLILQTGEYPEIGGIAKKTGPDREAYNYEISKFQLFQHLGYDVRFSVEETLARVRAGVRRGLTRRRCLPGGRSSASKKKRRSSKAWQLKERPDRWLR